MLVQANWIWKIIFYVQTGPDNQDKSVEDDSTALNLFNFAFISKWTEPSNGELKYYQNLQSQQQKVLQYWSLVVAVALVALVAREGDHRDRRGGKIEERVRVLTWQDERRLVERVKVACKTAPADAVPTDVWDRNPDLV